MYICTKGFWNISRFKKSILFFGLTRTAKVDLSSFVFFKSAHKVRRAAALVGGDVC